MVDHKEVLRRELKRIERVRLQLKKLGWTDDKINKTIGNATNFFYDKTKKQLEDGD